MATTYRYKWSGPSLIEVTNNLKPGVVPTLFQPRPQPLADITLSSDLAEDKTDLDGVMAALGWEFIQTNPPMPPRGVVVREVQEKRLITDETTTSTSFVDLLSIPITTDDGFIEAYATASTNVLIALGAFRLTLDGVPFVAGGCGVPIGAVGSISIIKRAPVTAGVHTVALQWRAGVGGTLRVRPNAFPDVEHATLLIKETN